MAVSLLFSLLSLPLRRFFVFFERFFSCLLSSLLSTESSIFERPTTHVWATYHYLRIRVHLNTLAIFIARSFMCSGCTTLLLEEDTPTDVWYLASANLNSRPSFLLSSATFWGSRLSSFHSCCDVSKAFYQYLYQRDLIWDIWFINLQVSSSDFWYILFTSVHSTNVMHSQVWCTSC